MIREQTVMTNDMPSSEAKSGLSAGKIAVVLAIGVAVAAFFYFDLGRFLSLQALKDNRDDLLSFTETHSAIAAALFVLTYVAVTGLSLPGAVILTLAGGFLFGAVWGRSSSIWGRRRARRWRFSPPATCCAIGWSRSLESGWVRFSKDSRRTRSVI